MKPILTFFLLLLTSTGFTQETPPDTIIYSKNKDYETLRLNWEVGVAYTYQVDMQDIKIQGTDTTKNRKVLDTITLKIYSREGQRIEFEAVPSKKQIAYNIFVPGCETSEWELAQLSAVEGFYFVEKDSFVINNSEMLAAFYQPFLQQSLECVERTDSLKMMAFIIQMVASRIMEIPVQVHYFLSDFNYLIGKTPELVPLVDTLKYEVIDYNDEGDTLSIYFKVSILEKDAQTTTYRFEEDQERGKGAMERLMRSMLGEESKESVPQMTNFQYAEMKVDLQNNLLEYHQENVQEMTGKGRRTRQLKNYELKFLNKKSLE